MLENLGFFVNLIPGHAELPGQEELDQAVVAEDLQGHPAPVGGQAHAAVGLMLDESELGQLAHHAGHRTRRNPQALRQLRGRHGGVTALLERIHRLGVVLDGSGKGVECGHRRIYCSP